MNASPLANASLRADLSYRPFLILLLIGLAVRVTVMISYFPAVMLSFDSARYARIDGRAIFGDYWMPAGYPMLLRVLRLLSDQLWVTIAVQHLIGSSLGVILYLVMRRLNVRRWVACLPASVAFLSGDHIYSEHIIMADFLLTFLAAAGLGAAVAGLADGVRMRWLAAAGALIGMATLARSVGIILIPVLAICTACLVRGTMRERLRATGTALGSALLVLAIYVLGFKLADGKFLGLADMRGWNLYSRVAPFADCRKFTPPAGTEVLCEATPPTERPGPFYYVWERDSIGRRNFKMGPETGAQVGAFAWQVLLHQPADYLLAVVADLWRYVEPATGRHWPYAGQTDVAIAFGWRNPAVEEEVIPALSRGYRGTELRVHGQQLLNAYQQLFRLTGLMLAALLILTGVGMWRARGALQAAIMLFGLGALGLYILPVATVCYDFRYGLPPVMLTAVSGVLGALSLVRRELVFSRE